MLHVNLHDHPVQFDGQLHFLHNEKIAELSNALMNYGIEMGELRLNVIRGEATKEDWKSFVDRYYAAGYAEIEAEIIKLLEEAYK